MILRVGVGAANIMDGGTENKSENKRRIGAYFASAIFYQMLLLLHRGAMVYLFLMNPAI